MFGQRILIAVPHPDDEIVACAAAIGHARAAGTKVFALYLTHGCIPQNEMWPWARHSYDGAVNLRRIEAEEAARFLDIEMMNWSPRPARYLWREMGKVAKEIRDAVIAHDIDQLWVPAYEGGNPDHDALNAIGQVFKKQISVLEFAEYNFKNGKAGAQTFPHLNGSEQTIHLTEAERMAKCAALAIYASEKSNLNYVRSERECFRPLADYDYNRPPHHGKLWYARFQWVPFRHPRVDFTNPADVSQAIDRFFKQNS